MPRPRKRPNKEIIKKEKPHGNRGIVELVWADPRSLDDHPDNWKTHPERQISSLSASIEANTFFAPVLYNLVTQKLLAGHARKRTAIRRKLDSIPVLLGRWSPEQELRILRDDNLLSQLGVTDQGALRDLNSKIERDRESLKALNQTTRQSLKRIALDSKHYVEKIEAGDVSPRPLPTVSKRIRPTDKEKNTIEGEKEEPSAIRAEIDEDVVFKSSNPFGLPDLRTDALATEVPRSTWDRRTPGSKGSYWYCFSSRPYPDTRVGGTLGFYTEDHRFSRAYEKPAAFVEELIEGDWSAVVEPDFSTYSTWPFVMRLWSVYRSRWCARFWQEFDQTIIPVIRKSPNPSEDAVWLYETLPKKIPVAAIKCTKKKDEIRNLYATLEVVCTHLKIRTMIVYGGKDAGLTNLPKGPKYVMLPTYISARISVVRPSGE